MGLVEYLLPGIECAEGASQIRPRHEVTSNGCERLISTNKQKLYSKQPFLTTDLADQTDHFSQILLVSENDHSVLLIYTFITTRLYLAKA